MRQYTLEEASLAEELTDRWAMALEVTDPDERQLWVAPIKLALHTLHQRLSGPPMSGQEVRRLRRTLYAELHNVAEPLEV